MKAIITFINGEKITATGEVVEGLRNYFAPTNGPHTTFPLGWVGIPDKALNFAHVMHVVFESEESE